MDPDEEWIDVKAEISALDNKQMALKIRLNSCYGAL